MAVEEACSLWPYSFTRRNHLPLLLFAPSKEFSIEIPDEEADEIKTVQQGRLTLNSASNFAHDLRQPLTISPKRQKVRA
jgi:hypothetical protein